MLTRWANLFRAYGAGSDEKPHLSKGTKDRAGLKSEEIRIEPVDHPPLAIFAALSGVVVPYV